MAHRDYLELTGGRLAVLGAGLLAVKDPGVSAAILGEIGGIFAIVAVLVMISLALGFVMAERSVRRTRRA
ncbi:MAG: hypothetical protein ACLPUO_13490 [Streptosporangiaceae bacterium]